MLPTLVTLANILIGADLSKIISQQLRAMILD
jgi:hypothetical protein